MNLFGLCEQVVGTKGVWGSAGNYSASLQQISAPTAASAGSRGRCQRSQTSFISVLADPSVTQGGVS